jgi:hypothetical protein
MKSLASPRDLAAGHRLGGPTLPIVTAVGVRWNKRVFFRDRCEEVKTLMGSQGNAQTA